MSNTIAATTHAVHKKGISITRTKLEVWSYAFCIFLLSMPFFVWHPPIHIAPLLAFVCFLASFRHIKATSKTFIPVLILLFLYFVIAITSGLNIVGVVSLLLICPFFLLKEEYVSDVFNAYVTIFSVTIIPSIFIYFLVTIVGISLPNSKIEGLNPDKTGDYFQYPFLVIYQEGGITLPSFFGYYDEPGVVGTIAAVLLSVRNFDLKVKTNIPIFIAGILSLSFFFLLIFSVYILVFAKVKFKIIVIVLTVFIVTQYLSNPVLYEMVFRRFEILPDGSFAGDNRISDKYFDVWYKTFRNSSSYYFGLGRDLHLKYNPGGSSYVDVIIDRGIVFFSTYVLGYFLLAYKKVKVSKELFIYSLILFGIMYQRPFIENMFYVFLLFAPIFALSKQRRLKMINI